MFLNLVVTVQRWVFNLTFAKISLPLALFFFILLLHPHTEIQVSYDPLLSNNYII